MVSFFIIACGGVKELVDNTEPFQLTQNPLVAAHLEANGDIAVTMTSADVTLWNTRTEQAFFSHAFLPDDEGQLLVQLSEDNQFLVTAGKRTTSLYDLKSKQKALVWKVYGTVENAQISAIAVSRFGDKVIAALTDGSVSVTDIKSKTRLLYQPHLSEVLFVRLNKLGNKLVTAGVDGRLVVLSLDSGVIEQEKQFPSRITALELDPRGEYIFVSDALSNENVSHINNINEFKTLDYLERSRHFRHALFVDRSTLVTTNSKYHISVWDLDQGEEIAKGIIEGYTASSSISDLAVKDSVIISLSNEGIIQTWSIPSR